MHSHRSKGQFSKYGIPLSRCAVFCICGRKCSASYALIKDHNKIKVILLCEKFAKNKALLCKGSCQRS